MTAFCEVFVEESCPKSLRKPSSIASVIGVHSVVPVVVVVVIPPIVRNSVARTPVANHDEQIGYIDDAVLVDVCR